MVRRSIKQSGYLFLSYMTVSKVMWSKYRTYESSGIDSIAPLPLKRKKWLAFSVKRKKNRRKYLQTPFPEIM